MSLTSNDQRVLEAVADACEVFDGFAPHGSSNWIGVRRLLKKNLITSIGDGICETCAEPHDTELFAVVEVQE